MTSLSSIGPATFVRGNVHGDGDLEIFGRVEGSVLVSGDVTIGEGALIQSDVRGRRVTVRGAVAGNVSGEEAVVLEAGARVVGDLGAPQIGIRPGALVRGNVATGAPLAPAAQPSASAAQRPAPAASRPAPSARPRVTAPAGPAARPSPPAARPVSAAKPPAVARPAPPAADHRAVEAAPTPAESQEPKAEAAPGGPPPPVVPAIRKGAKGSLRRKGGAR